VRPGDTVAFISSFTDVASASAPVPPQAKKTHLILHKLLVTNVQGAPLVAATPASDGTATARPAAPEGSLLVTLAVDAAASERIAFTSEFGTIYLAREPADAPEGGTIIQSIDTIFG
jgi:pilus assembly protein CpaB